MGLPSKKKQITGARFTVNYVKQSMNSITAALPKTVSFAVVFHRILDLKRAGFLSGPSLTRDTLHVVL